MGKVGAGSVLGDMSGVVGPIVVTRWKKTGVVKIRPKKPKKGKKTPKQAKQRDLFSVVTDFLSQIGERTLNDGYQLSRRAKMTPGNAALSYHIMNALTGESTDYKIDFSRVKLSRPLQSTEQAWNARFTVAEERKLSIDWELNSFPQKSTRQDDIGIIVFFNITENTVVARTSSKSGPLRSVLKFSYTAAERHVGHDFCGWMFFISADGKRVSETEYLGTLKLMD
ncbi:DUF6266 family protein [Pedobacter hartonius]|uniref:Uncharacterized protein n=1 Tax=Pedobacter hartonius TaxID=425514 RepID=A0A1H3WSZ6_9SPHI|nr:DUF6266 family protein [Pedobacter hartonius]SDZ89318.1 hypothetical protein SAMN05443550_101352 [Pedobacter hartonius]